MVRSCPRCVKDFEASEFQWVCLECRSPKTYQKAIFGEKLTNREKSVIAHLAECKSNKEIAYSLHLEASTVKVYMNKIFVKLGFTNRLQLAMWANSEEFTRLKSDTISQ